MPSITDLAGVRVGHATDRDAATGCTVVLFDEPALGGIDIGGGYASLRQADSLRPGGRVNQVHGFLLTGGSAFGMDAAGGCMAFLEERGVGFPATVARIPTVPTAVLFDLGIGSRDVRPDAGMGYAACVAASRDPVQEGNVGAGTGCTVAKRLGYELAWKGGLGSFAAEAGGFRVGALAAVNALGDVVDPSSGAPLAVARGPGRGWRRPAPEAAAEAAPAKAGLPGSGENTTLVVVCTDAPFDRNQLCHLARMAHDGLALAIRPAHTPFDGDVVFTASTAPRDRIRADDLVLAEVGMAAIEVVAEAIARGVKAARTLHGIPGLAGA
ncbi:P1 family peptidase [Vulgatibacter incomptus]|uniref:Endo-type 6-aminohexanoate oligomer hydrolase n=1 Tax=Vulgatibacter incomptus TaxID=1391653 RepID=A0A0K1PGS2_9BACT|nr:P1 family peptidase [Vulgatibacter incomptus]AKU92319.1 endo-type 6-aminohexanoate oligomer hydrolase [Vulgatibacter incomptus]